MDARQNRCPDCGSPLGAAPGPRCPRCRLPLTGPEAVELWNLDRTLADLATRRAWLLQRRGILIAALRSRPFTAPAGLPAAHAAAWPQKGVPAGVPGPDARKLSVQTVLLVLGAVLTSIAGIVFTLVNWGHLGIAGRAVVLVVVTALAFTAHLSLRTRLAATAETAAAVGLGLVLLDCYAARAAGLAGLDGVPADAYGTAVTALVSAGAWAHGRWTRSVVMPWGALLLVQVTIPFAAATVDGGRVGWAIVLAAGAALDLGSAVALRSAARRGTFLAPATTAAAGVWAAAGCLVAGSALRAAGPGSAFGPVLRACVPLVLLVLLGATAALRRELPYVARVVAGALSGVALIAVAGSVPRAALPASCGVIVYAVPTTALAIVAVIALGRTAGGRGAGRHPLWTGFAASGALLWPIAMKVLPGLLRALGQPLRRPAATAAGHWQVAAEVPVVAALVAVTLGTVAHLLTGRGAWGAGVRAAPAAGVTGAAAGPGAGTSRVAGEGAGELRAAEGVVPGGTGEPDEAEAGSRAAGDAVPGRGAGPAVTPVPQGRSTSVLGVLVWCAAIVAAVPAVALSPVAAGLPFGAALAAAWVPAASAAANLVRRGGADTTPRLCAVAAPAALALVWSLPQDAAALVVWGATALLAAGLAAALRGSDRDGIAQGAAAFTVIALGVEAARAAAAAGLPTHLAAFAVLGVAVASAPAAALLRGTAVEVTGYGVGGAAVLMTLGHANAAGTALAVAGAAALGVALRADRRRAAALTATALLTLSTWIRLAAAGVSAPEPYTVPVGVAALVLGHLHRRRFPATGSWRAYGPGLGLTLVPALGAAWADVHWVRPLLLGLAALAVTLAGARYRLRAPLLLGAAVLAVDALHELAPAIAQSLGLLPRWVPVAGAGLLLLFLGATYERRLADSRRLRAHLRRLT
ncbi:SCO7613 C-terminal domain-containing membrane protein [Actinacidiphila acidipaludis]|uniref:Integral membrane protein n=1 Tax=Actinacidiphila acidipaludis TaxID=2873382 RepID=A0ABS7QI23_9ACTN|nr:hypothetical protein [Streptomyces acidipaludis]MBY8882436.1 hypothetical protein [Streptomyces acidipaludis]